MKKDKYHQNEIIDELQKLVNTYKEINNNLLSMVGIREYQLQERENKIKELEAQVNSLKWQFPSNN